MTALKCKMCGGNIEVGENRNIGVCDSCGSIMTIPNVNDERILNLFDRANHFRLQNEFDKALSVYESILSENNKNAEAHWGCVLSRYGIEYVEDPKTHKRVPTCHRVQSESVLSDLDYKAAVEFSDDVSVKNLYKQEAEAIAEIQKNILSIANNESPYDVFICYKETDNNGRRTVDSTLAQDIYYQLTNEGYKVFFSRITLEDKLGAEYEPYIFSALNSAKVMLVIGTSKDYFNAVWVKNEWARFLDLARKDKSKMIIPCYRDMDAYDLPDELSMFQSQDMGKIGFIQDLIRGIKKVLQKETPQPTVTVVNNTSEAFNCEALLKRAFMFLEDAEWQKADELLEQVLNHDPENAKAYVGKLMIDFDVDKEENLWEQAIDFSQNANYQKAIRFGDEKLKRYLEEHMANSLNKLKQLEEERTQKNEKNQEIRRQREEFVKSKRKAHSKELCTYAGILFAATFITVIGLILYSRSIDIYYDYGETGRIIAVTIFLAISSICTWYFFASNPGYDECMKNSAGKDFEFNVDKMIKKHKKVAKAITLIGVIIIIISSLVLGMDYWKYDTVRGRFESLEYVTNLIKSNPTIEKIESESFGKGTFRSLDDSKYGFKGVSNAESIMLISYGGGGATLDKNGNVTGLITQLSYVFDSLSISYESDTMNLDELKATLGNCEEVEVHSVKYLLFEINGCNVYINELEFDEFNSFSDVFITNKKNNF